MFTLNSGITHIENTFVLWLHGKVFVVLSCYSCYSSLLALGLWIQAQLLIDKSKRIKVL